MWEEYIMFHRFTLLHNSTKMASFKYHSLRSEIFLKFCVQFCDGTLCTAYMMYACMNNVVQRLIFCVSTFG